MMKVEFPGGFAVLMAVYRRDDAALFDRAIASVFSNSLQPQSVCLVADGPLTTELDAVAQKWSLQGGGRVHLFRLAHNQGLAHALNFGLQRIREPWVVRADADDINLPHRFETLARLLQRQPELELMSSAILEVTPEGDPLAVRELPLGEAEIRQYAKTRNPFNHMAVAYRRASVLAVGSYPAVYLKEDYALWCRMLAKGVRVANTADILVHATAGADMYRRRGGWKYARAEWEIQRLLVDCGLKPWWRAWLDGLMRAAVFLAPASVRGVVYARLLRTRP